MKRRQPHTFYMAAVNGGVWKTTDAGRTWLPIFDDQPTGSIGSIAVAPSDPNTVYVGSGEGLHRPDLSTGDGVYKSTDAGRTWARLGLNDAQQIPCIDVDPAIANRVFVAALDHPYGPNEERGIFRVSAVPGLGGRAHRVPRLCLGSEEAPTAADNGRSVDRLSGRRAEAPANVSYRPCRRQSRPREPAGTASASRSVR